MHSVSNCIEMNRPPFWTVWSLHLHTYLPHVMKVKNLWRLLLHFTGVQMAHNVNSCSWSASCRPPRALSYSCYSTPKDSEATQVKREQFFVNLLPHHLLPSHLLTQMPAAGFAATGLPVAPRPGVAAVRDDLIRPARHSDQSRRFRWVPLTPVVLKSLAASLPLLLYSFLS